MNEIDIGKIVKLTCSNIIAYIKVKILSTHRTILQCSVIALTIPHKHHQARQKH